jgi:S-layer protein
MSFPTSANQIQAFAGAMYGTKVGTVTMAQVNNDILAYGGLSKALNIYYAASFDGVPTATVAATMAANLGLTGDALTTGTNYITGQLNVVAANARGEAIAGILNLFKTLATDATFGDASTAWTAKVTAANTYVGADNEAFGTAVPVAGKAFPLTTGVDIWTGGAGADVVTAGNGTFTSLDKLTGGEGSDTLNITSTAAFTTPTGATTASFENINLTAAGGAVFDTSTGYTDLTTLTVANTGGAVTVKAAATTDATVTSAAPAGAASGVTGGKGVTLSVTGATATTDTATVGSTTLPAAGNVSINYTGSVAIAATDAALGAITVTGGKEIAINATAANSGTAFTNTASTGAITVTGNADTTSVTVTQNTPKGVTAASVAAANNNNAVVGVLGVGNGTVVIADLNGTTGVGNTLSSVSLKNQGATSTITSSALSSLTLASDGVSAAGAQIASGLVTITNNQSNPTATTLALNVSGRHTGLTVANNEITTINATVPAAARIATITDSGLTTLNIDGAAQLRVDNALPAALNTITVSGAAGFRGTIVGTAVTSFDSTKTTGTNQVTVNSASQTYTGGAGNDTVTISGNATKAISGGDGTDTLIVPAATYTAANVGANVTGFEKFQTIGTASVTADLSLFTGSTFTTIESSGAVGLTNTISNIAPGASYIVSYGGAATNGTATAGVPNLSTGTHVLTSSDFSGFTDVAKVTLKGVAPAAGTGTIGTLTTALTLADANGTGFGTANFVTDATVAGGRSDITTLTANYLANLSITGTGSLTIGALTTNSATLTISDTNTSSGASGITTLTANNLANLAYSGTHAFTTALAAGNTATAVTISNANTGTSGVLTVGATALNLAAKITLNGSVAATLTSTLATAQKLIAGTDNSNISFTNTAGTTVKTITAGNGNNTIVTGAGADVITLGTGANSVTPGAGGDTITFDVSHTGVDTVIYGAAAETATTTITNGNVVISAATGFDIITGMKAADTIDLTALTEGVFTAAAVAPLTTYMTGGITGDIALIRGNYNSVTGYFTSSSTGADTLVQWDSDGTGVLTAVDTILLVGFANTASTSTADGLITLA